ncbi:PIG-L family deacetylase [Achromobacter ruhlandii]|uniref:PIG-L family deacetylase n=1 Tax=Achromobacter ruhlandii TaxID=72557 RepID=UPI0007BF1F03|nr:PIG-L family deacetylase [Achromobacter ruhlandii]
MPANPASRPLSLDDAAALPRLVILSPHLDDAALSCAGLLRARPGSVVATVYSGLPPDAGMLTDWDRRCGFASAGQAMRTRAGEDDRALEEVRAERMTLDFIDSQYLPCADADMPALTERLLRLVADLRPDGVLIPMGLLHHDHVRVSDAALLVREARREAVWFAYEDVPYRDLPGQLQERLGRLHARGVRMAPLDWRPDVAGKARVLAAYASQLRASDGRQTSWAATSAIGACSTGEPLWRPPIPASPSWC